MIDFNEDLLKKAEAMPEEVDEETLHEAMLNAISYLGASAGERDHMSMSTLEYVNKIYIDDKNVDKKSSLFCTKKQMLFNNVLLLIYNKKHEK